MKRIKIWANCLLSENLKPIQNFQASEEKKYL